MGHWNLPPPPQWLNKRTTCITPTACTPNSLKSETLGFYSFILAH